MNRDLRMLALVSLGFVLAAWPVTGHAEAYVPLVVHPGPAPLGGVIDPAKLPVAATSTKNATPRLIPNVFPEPGEIPAGKSEAAAPSASGPGAINVIDDGSTPKTPAGILAYPAIDGRFDAPYDGGVAPPDPGMAVGRDHVVAILNLLIGMYTKSGALAAGPYSLASFFNVPAGFSTFDPLVVYDPYADRFIVSATADNGAAQDSRIFVAFSQTNNPTGLWNKYYIPVTAGQASNWADYPSIGLDRLAVYFTANMFVRGGGFSNVTLFIYSKDDGYAGRPLRSTHLIDVRTASGGSPFRLRPAYVPEMTPGDEYFLAHTDSSFGDRLNLFRLTGSRFAAPQLAASSILLDASFLTPYKGRQPGAGKGVDTLGSSIWNVYYRRGTLWTAMAVTGAASIAAKVHEFNVAVDPAVRLRTWAIETAGKDTYFPYVIPDTDDDDFTLLSAFSGSDTYVTGRYWNIAADGTVRAAELLATGALRNDSQRHGDYFNIGTDPWDRNRIWMIAQYMKNSTFAGNSGIATVRFEDLPVPAPPPPVPDGKAIAGQGIQVARAAAGQVQVTWDVAHCPAPGDHLVWFDLAQVKNYVIVGETCGAGPSGSWTGPPPAGNVGVIVVSDDSSRTEGSHGQDSAGRERPSTSRQCGFTQKITFGACSP